MGFSLGGAASGGLAGNFLAGPLGGLAGAVYGGFFNGMDSPSQSASSARDINRWQVELAREQMAFQERMSNTAHQRQVKDLRDAGLNPILSATGGSGASSPGGAMAVLENPDKNLATDKALIGNMKANTAKMLSEAMVNKTQANLNIAATQQRKGNIPGTNIPITTAKQYLQQMAKAGPGQWGAKAAKWFKGSTTK